MMFANTGNVGLPIVNLALGNEGMALAIAYSIPGTVAVMTIGFWLPMRRLTLGTVLRAPVIYAIIIGVASLAFQIPPPAPIQNALTILGGAAIPLMLLSLGYSIATLKLGDLGLGFRLAVAHYAVAATAALITLQVVTLDSTARGSFLLEAMMPVGVTVYLIAQRYSSQEETRTIASMVMFSTLMTIIVIPLVLAFWI